MKPSIYWLFVFIPVTVILEHAGKLPPPVIFFSAALAIVPIAALIVQATEQISTRTGDAIGGLLNATFGNAPELIIATVALRAGYLDMVRASLIGAILANLLLALGLSFFLGGLRYRDQKYNPLAARTYSTMMLIAVISLLVPSAFSRILAPESTIRQEQLLKDLPDTLDLLAISVEAGVGFEGALGIVCEHFDSPLADEFSRTLKEMELGLPRRDALQNLNHRRARRHQRDQSSHQRLPGAVEKRAPAITQHIQPHQQRTVESAARGSIRIFGAEYILHPVAEEELIPKHSFVAIENGLARDITKILQVLDALAGRNSLTGNWGHSLTIGSQRRKLHSPGDLDVVTAKRCKNAAHGASRGVES